MKFSMQTIEPKPAPPPLDNASRMIELEHLSIIIWQLALLHDEWQTWHSTADAFKKLAYYREYDFTRSTDLEVSVFITLRNIARARKAMCNKPVIVKEQMIAVSRNFTEELDDLLGDWGFGGAGR